MRDRESNTLFASVMKAITQELRDVHTTLIGKVVAVNKTTIDVKPVISRLINDEKRDLPIFKDVPVVFLQGGANNLAFPVKVGDDCLLMVNERCFDNWYEGVDFETPPDARMQDYSDTFALVGINPEKSAISIPTGNETVHNGDLHIEGGLRVEGNITATGDIVAGNGAVSLLNHTHGGVKPGGSSTFKPN